MAKIKKFENFIKSIYELKSSDLIGTYLEPKSSGYSDGKNLSLVRKKYGKPFEDSSKTSGVNWGLKFERTGNTFKVNFPEDFKKNFKELGRNLDIKKSYDDKSGFSKGDRNGDSRIPKERDVIFPKGFEHLYKKYKSLDFDPNKVDFKRLENIVITIGHNDEEKYNRTHFGGGIPNEFLGIGLGYIIYEEFIKHLGYASSKDNASSSAKKVWSKIATDPDFYSIVGNGIFVVCRDRVDEFKSIIIDYIKYEKDNSASKLRISQGLKDTLFKEDLNFFKDSNIFDILDDNDIFDIYIHHKKNNEDVSILDERINNYIYKILYRGGEEEIKKIEDFILEFKPNLKKFEIPKDHIDSISYNISKLSQSFDLYGLFPEPLSMILFIHKIKKEIDSENKDEIQKLKSNDYFKDDNLKKSLIKKYVDIYPNSLKDMYYYDFVSLSEIIENVSDLSYHYKEDLGKYAIIKALEEKNSEKLEALLIYLDKNNFLPKDTIYIYGKLEDLILKCDTNDIIKLISNNIFSPYSIISLFSSNKKQNNKLAEYLIDNPEIMAKVPDDEKYINDIITDIITDKNLLNKLKEIKKANLSNPSNAEERYEYFKLSYPDDKPEELLKWLYDKGENQSRDNFVAYIIGMYFIQDKQKILNFISKDNLEKVTDFISEIINGDGTILFVDNNDKLSEEIDNIELSKLITIDNSNKFYKFIFDYIKDEKAKTKILNFLSKKSNENLILNYHKFKNK